ncbi:MAG: class I SAM-dependent RNA methyltransferase, partial [Clostridiales bacterium]|nr:class I SAM-dependent RNA methyltransferase [Clostridiales bacterium]
MKQDDIITLTITDYGMEGEGIGKVDNYTVFVPFAAKGEKVKAKVTYVKRNLVFSKLIEFIEPSENRVDYKCNRFMRCGGCNLLHLRYGEQLKIKRKNLINLLKKNTNIEIDVDDTVPSPKPFAYRNKIQLPFGTVNGKVAVGFYRRNTHKIVSIAKCFLHGDWVEKIIAIFLEFANDNNLTAFDDLTKEGLLKHLVVRNLSGKLCIVLVINGQELPYKEKLINKLDKEFLDTYLLYI